MGAMPDSVGLRKMFASVVSILCILPLVVSEEVRNLESATNPAQCHAFTLKPSQYVRQGATLRLVDDKAITIGLENADVTEDGTAQVCFPFSDNFQTCTRKTIPAGGYQVLPSLSVMELQSGHQWPLGEYDILSQGSAVVCAAPPRRRRRCNYLILQSDEYAVQEDGALLIKPANETLPNANFVVDITTQAANVCYPLTPEFLNCSKWLLEWHEFAINANKHLSDLYRDHVHGPGDYVVFKSGKAAVCITGNVVKPDDGFNIYTLHAVAQIISAICLLVAIVIHIILPDLSYQRAPLLCQAFSLMVMFLCLSARRMHQGFETAGCYALFYVTYYFCLAAFFWLTVLAFDIWRISIHLRTGTKGYHWVNYFVNKKFLFYALFGWGVPVLLMVLLAIVDTHENIQRELMLFPRIQRMCWFNDRTSAYAFFFGPMCTLLAVNFVFFGLSVYNIWRASRDAEFTNMKLNKQLLVICFIVFLAMGLFWVMEVVSYGTLSHGIIWLVPDLINASQGVIIAAVYTCRPLTIRSLREKFCHRQVGKQ